MSMRNFTQPHKQVRDCIRCGNATPALVNGEIREHVCCDACSFSFETDFKKAAIQRDTQRRAEAQVRAGKVPAKKGGSR